jgi:hypothetical protein
LCKNTAAREKLNSNIFTVQKISWGNANPPPHSREKKGILKKKIPDINLWKFRSNFYSYAWQIYLNSKALQAWCVPNATCSFTPPNKDKLLFELYVYVSKVP